MKREKTVRFKVSVPASTFKEIKACRDRWHELYAPGPAEPIPISEFCVCLLDRAASRMLIELEGKGREGVLIMPDKTLKVTLAADLYERVRACLLQIHGRTRPYVPPMPVDQFISLLVEYALDCYAAELDMEMRCDRAE